MAAGPLPARLSRSLTLARASAAAAVATGTVRLARPGARVPLSLAAAEARRLSLRVPLRARRPAATAPCGTASVAVAVEPAAPAARLSNREVRVLPFRRLALGTGQRGANEAPVHRTIFIR